VQASACTKLDEDNGSRKCTGLVTTAPVARYTGMWGSVLVYSALVLACVGLAAVIRPALSRVEGPVPRIGLDTRLRGVAFALGGLAVAVGGLLLPAFESRAVRATSRLDEFAPAWQFREVHTLRVAAPPDRVFDAIKQVRADEILLFRTLTWIRRGGRQLRPSIMNAGSQEPLLDIATRGGFIWLADDRPREVVVGTVVGAPAGYRPGMLTPSLFKVTPPGFAVATMNFVVRSDGPNASIVTTETRVFASSASSRRRFAAYWRVIYPGSAVIRRMWLRAIERRATTA
jgi:hypothetical protein